MFTKISFKAAFAFGAFAMALSFGLVSCNKNKAEQPAPAAKFEQSPITSSFDLPVAEISDDFDAENARTAAVANPLTYRIKHTGSCSADVSIVYRAGADNTTTYADSSRAKKYFPTGTWKSFTIKQANLNKVLGKTLDKTQAYTFYVRNKTAKTATKLGTISANPSIFQATETKAYSNDLTSWATCQ